MTAKVSNLAAEAFGWTLLALYWILRSAKKLSASVMLPMRDLRGLINDLFIPSKRALKELSNGGLLASIGLELVEKLAMHVEATKFRSISFRKLYQRFRRQQCVYRAGRHRKGWPSGSADDARSLKLGS